MTVDELKALLRKHEQNHTPAAEVVKMLDDLAPDETLDRPLYRKVHQQRALWQSKYGDEPAEMRHAAALAHMRSRLALKTTTDRETLGIAGGICKRMWLHEGQRVHLDRAIAFYRRGYESGEANDDYYTGINAAYLEELIAEQELLADVDPKTVEERYQRARGIYETIIAAVRNGSFTPDNWWHYATVADAHLGLGDSATAADWLRRGIASFNPKDDDRITTLRQSAHLIQLQAPRRTDGWSLAAQKHLAKAFHIKLRAVRGAVLGKVGLALSGGGFRASLYHIGVLARLAELDLLRHVEVLSCVSGGSIIGAQYYLELRHLLEHKKHLTRRDYLDVVHNLETKFLDGVKSNIRTAAATNLRLDLKMIFDADYSRTERVAELYEQKLFARTPATTLDLNDMKIQPAGVDGEFRPRSQNWKQSAKVPVLVLNATTLNTGHQWQFTAAEMGEPPYTRHQLDAVEILPRRGYAPDERMRLSRAVAASSGVPGLFAPLTIHRDGRTIRLVDGGVHDNQGVASLLEQECKTILVSDASGQLAAQQTGSDGVAAPPLRSNAILQARLREAQIVDLLSRRRAGVLQGVAFVHMTQGLDNNATPATPTTYGVRHDLQKMLAEMRTDLDSFTDAEGYSLMISGYRMMSEALHDSVNAPGLSAMASRARPHRWDFLRVAGAIDGSDPNASRRLYEILSNSGHNARNPRRLLAALQLAFIIALVPILLLSLPFVLWAIIGRWRNPNYPKSADEVLAGILMATGGWVASNLYLTRYEPKEQQRGAWPG